MKKNEVYDILNKINFDTLFSQNLTPYKITQKISLDLGETKAPSQTAITNYIENQLNQKWNPELKKWIPYQKDKNNNKIQNKNRLKNDYNSIVTYHENEIDDEYISESSEDSPMYIETKDTPNNGENISTESIINTSSSVAKIKEKNNTISNTFSFKSDFKDELIDPSEYAEYTTALGTEKYSLSLSRFTVELAEQRTSKKYNINRKGARSKLIQLALQEYLRLTKDEDDCPKRKK